MQVDMKDALPSGFANIHTDIVSIRMKLFIYNSFHFLR